MTRPTKLICAPSEDADQPGHPHILIRILTYVQWESKDQRFLHPDSEDSD